MSGFRWRTLSLLPLLLLWSPQERREEPEFDIGTVQEIRAKQQKGEALTPEEADYLERFQERRRRLLEAFQKDHPHRDSTGLVPLTELRTGGYKGAQGGLYPGGENTPPQPHLDAGLSLGRAIRPLNAEGLPAAGGKIVLVAVGMSNTTQEFQAFLKLAETDRELNSHLVLVDGAQGGQSAELTSDPDGKFWLVLEKRLASAGVSSRQVQVAWVKQAIHGPSGPFPQEVRKFKTHLLGTLHVMTERFPNLKIAYLSSRIYAGHARTPLNPEPHAYESGFAVKWLIADQIAGKPELNYDPKRGAFKAPWLAWAPYL